jgi:Type I phosphodiesterase / nucleotide pyrophosphatase
LTVKVLLVVIDAAEPRVVCPAIQTGQLPNMNRLLRAGCMHKGSTTIFPSITPAATTAIITGTYPEENGIAGAAWYDAATNDIAYYGDDFWVIVREGFRAFLRDFLVRLNGDRLTAPTLFEMVEQRGKIAASVNYLVYKGLHEHKVHVPLLLAMLPGAPLTEVVNGPTVLCLGDFASSRTLHRRKLDGKEGVLHRFGMDDSSSGQYLAELAEDKAMPDLTVAYFADNDYRSHEVGPFRALGCVEHVDEILGTVFACAGGMERFLEDTYVIVTSDHGHCEVLDDRDRAVVHLDQVLCDFRKAALGKPWRDKDEVMICPNMRSAQIYFHRPTAENSNRTIRMLLAEPRIDHVMWKTVDTRDNALGFTVASKWGALEFRVGDDGSNRARDAFGTVWSYHGDLGVIGARGDDGELEWGDYPNAFERIAGSLQHRRSGMIWATAVPGSEFEVMGGKAHVGGASHGGLHALESLSPVLVAGPRPVRLPAQMRSIDLAPLIMELLELPMRYRVGQPRTARML